MTVGEVRILLENSPIPSGSVVTTRNAKEELDRLCASLQPFQDLSVGEFTEILSKARRRRPNAAPAQKSARRPKPRAKCDDEKVAAAEQKIEQLRRQVTSPTLDYDTIATEMMRLGETLNKEEAVAVAKRVGAVAGATTRKDALEAIGYMIRTLKKSFERNSGREQQRMSG